MDGDLTDADTALPGQGTSILGLNDNEKFERVRAALAQFDNQEQYVFLKLLTGTFRPGVSKSVV